MNESGSTAVSFSPGIVQGTRGLMLSAIFFSFISILVEMVGMRCTTCMADEPERKDKVALAGGIIFIIAGQSTIDFLKHHQACQDIFRPMDVTLLCCMSHFDHNFKDLV